MEKQHIVVGCSMNEQKGTDQVFLFFSSRGLNWRGVILAPDDVGGCTGVWSGVPDSGVCRVAALAGWVVALLLDYYLHSPRDTSESASYQKELFALCR
jgi:hypothetical protein